MKIVLASVSPRRKILLKNFGFKFIQIKPNVDERKILNELKNKNPYKIAGILAFEKAKSVSDKIKNGIILGADTIVVLKNEIIGKPDTKKHAISILKKLSNSTHRVITAVALIDAVTFKTIIFTDTSFVSFKKLSLKDIKDYIDKNNVLDKAGAYAIQEGADPFIKEIKGSYYNVVGLPIEKLKKVLRIFVKNM